MELSDALQFAGDQRRGVLVTLRRDGHPQLSNIMYDLGGDGVFRISITADRAKYHNLLRNPWAALHVTQADFYAYAVLEGDVELSDVAADVADATVEELVGQYERLMGQHDDWDKFRQAMVEERRVVVRLRPARAYGMLPLPR